MSRDRRGISPIIASLFLVAITITAGVALWAFRPNLPAQPITITYIAEAGGAEPAWGDGTDCHNVMNKTSGQTYQSCITLPSFAILLTGTNAQSLPLSELTFLFVCNGTVYLSANLTNMEWVPGTAATVGGPPAPQLGKCGTYTAPKAAWDRLAFYDQVKAGDPYWESGDQIILYAHSFEPPNCPNPSGSGASFVCDDDYHGAPTWCYSVPNACTLMLLYGGYPPSVALKLPLFGLSQ